MTAVHPHYKEIMEQITLLKKCQNTQRSFSTELATARATIANVKAELAQAHQTLEQAKAISRMDSLLGPNAGNESLRKAAVEKGWAECQAVQDAQKEIRTLQHTLQAAEDILEKIRDLRRSCEYAQTAAGHIITAYQIKGVIDATSSRQQPEQYCSH